MLIWGIVLDMYLFLMFMIYYSYEMFPNLGHDIVTFLEMQLGLVFSVLLLDIPDHFSSWVYAGHRKIDVEGIAIVEDSATISTKM